MILCASVASAVSEDVLLHARSGLELRSSVYNIRESIDIEFHIHTLILHLNIMITEEKSHFFFVNNLNLNFLGKEKLKS